MGYIIGIIIVIAIIFIAGVAVFDVIEIGLFPQVLTSTIPMALFCLAIGLISQKRISKTAAGWIIFGMLLAQNFAAYAFWGNVPGTGRHFTELVITSILVSLVFVIPGIVATAKGK